MTKHLHSLAPYLQNFFAIRLKKERGVSENTLDSYKRCFTLIFDYAEKTLNLTPDNLLIEHLDAAFIGSFLSHLETDRDNTVNTRNARLSAIRSFFRYVAVREPDLLHQCDLVIDIPKKRGVKKQVEYLHDHEAEALLAMPSRRGWYGRRDRLILEFAINTGLRVSELISVKCKDIQIAHRSIVRVLGKGRKDRSTPVPKQIAAKVSNWILENHYTEGSYLFCQKNQMPLSRDSIGRIVKKYNSMARIDCYSLKGKNITPHTLRHTCAMRLLKAGVSLPVIALWLGHEKLDSTGVYLHADTTIMKDAMDLLNDLEVPTETSENLKSDHLRKFMELV